MRAFATATTSAPRPPLSALMRRQRGYTMLEITVTLVLFGIFLFIIVSLTAEMRRNEKRWPVNFMSHPDVGAVVARFRRDVYDSKYFPDSWQAYSQSAQTPIIYTINATGAETVVWDFRTPGQVTRLAWSSTQSDWTAHGTPTFAAEKFDAPNGQTGMHITAVDDKGKLAIDQIFIPRPHD